MGDYDKGHPQSGHERMATIQYHGRLGLIVELWGEPGVNDPARPLPKPIPDLLCPSCKGDKKVTVAGAVVNCRKCHGIGRVWSEDRKHEAPPPPTAQEKMRRARKDKETPLLGKPVPLDDEE